MVIFNDGIMSAELLPKNWLFLVWENNKIGRLPVSLVKNLKSMERIIKVNKWAGWVCNSEKEHEGMHKILKRVGAEVYDEDDEVFFFKKEISHVQSN